MTVKDTTISEFGLAVGAGEARDRPLLDVVDKYRGGVAYRVATATPEDVDEAVRLARDGVALALPAHRRHSILGRAAQLLESRRDDLVDALIAEAGKPRRASIGEVSRAVETLQWSAEEAKRLRGETIPLDAAASGVGRLAITLREPVGVVAAITPTNSPLNLVAHKVGPALAGGNAVVLKPPQSTPVCSLLLREVLLQAGLPPGLCSVVVGPGVGETMLQHPGIDFYNFTGSVAVGEKLRSRIGLRDSLMELGGNSPVIVHDDADVQRAATACAQKGFSAAGQACTSVQRIHVHERVLDAFRAALLEQVASLHVGDPRDPDTLVGAMIDVGEAERVESWIDEAVAAGAQCHTDRRREGALLWPTVLENVPTDLPVYCQEVFGPVVVLQPYRDLADAISAANSTKYGLHAAIFTASLDVAFVAIRGLRSGGVLVNEATQWRTEFVPFGGVGASGSGREGLPYAVEQMTRTKLAMLALDPGTVMEERHV